MVELTKEEKREKSKQMKDKMKYVEQQSRFRKAQTELQENGLENIINIFRFNFYNQIQYILYKINNNSFNNLYNTTTNTKREIMRALENEMDDQQLKHYQGLQKKLVRMNYYGSFFGLTTASILPRTFRFYQKLGLVSRVTICVSTFLITQKGVSFKYLCDVDQFEVDFIEKHKTKFLDTSFES